MFSPLTALPSHPQHHCIASPMDYCKDLLMLVGSVYALLSNSSPVSIVIFQKIQLFFRRYMYLIEALCCLPQSTSNTPQCRMAFNPGIPSFAGTLAGHHHCTLCSTLQDLSLFHSCAFAPAVSSGRNFHPCPSMFTGLMAACVGSSLSVLQIAPSFYHIIEPINVCFSSLCLFSHLTLGSLKAGQ